MKATQSKSASDAVSARRAENGSSLFFCVPLKSRWATLPGYDWLCLLTELGTRHSMGRRLVQSYHIISS